VGVYGCWGGGGGGGGGETERERERERRKFVFVSRVYEITRPIQNQHEISKLVGTNKHPRPTTLRPPTSTIPVRPLPLTPPSFLWSNTRLLKGSSGLMNSWPLFHSSRSPQHETFERSIATLIHSWATPGRSCRRWHWHAPWFRRVSALVLWACSAPPARRGWCEGES